MNELKIIFLTLFVVCVNTAVGQINNSNVEFEELKKNAEIKEERKRRRRLRALTPKKTNPHQKSSIRLLYQQVSEDEQPESKVPVKGVRVKLLIQNNHNIDMWYLMPAAHQQALPSTGLFVATKSEQIFSAYRYEASNKSLIELEFKGVEHSFRAICVPAGGSVLMRNYAIGNYKKGGTVPFWVVKKLLINQKVPLKKWLHSNLISTDGVQIKQLSVPSKPYDLILSSEYQAAEIGTVQASIHQKFNISVGKAP